MPKISAAGITAFLTAVAQSGRVDAARIFISSAHSTSCDLCSVMTPASVLLMFLSPRNHATRLLGSRSATYGVIPGLEVFRIGRRRARNSSRTRYRAHANAHLLIFH